MRIAAATETVITAKKVCSWKRMASVELADAEGGGTAAGAASVGESAASESWYLGVLLKSVEGLNTTVQSSSKRRRSVPAAAANGSAAPAAEEEVGGTAESGGSSSSPASASSRAMSSASCGSGTAPPGERKPMVGELCIAGASAAP